MKNPAQQDKPTAFLLTSLDSRFRGNDGKEEMM
jgi:hypothetical protein